MPLAIADPGLRGGSANSSAALQLTASGGTPPYSYSLSSSPGLPPGVQVDAAGLITGTLGGPQSYSVTATVTDSTGATASTTFEWRVSDWNVGDVFVGINGNVAGNGEYEVLRPQVTTQPDGSVTHGVSSLETVEVPLSSWSFSDGTTAGCAVDWFSGLLYTTDFDSTVSEVNSLPDAGGIHGILRQLKTPRLPGAEPGDPPFTQDPNGYEEWVSWQPESIVFSADRRMYVGHVGGLFTGSLNLADVTRSYGNWEMLAAEDGFSRPIPAILPQLLYDASGTLKAAAEVVTAAPVPGEPGWYFVLDYNDPLNPVRDLAGAAPDVTNPATWGQGLSGVINPATTTRTVDPNANFNGVYVNQWGFWERAPGVPVLDVNNERVPARRQWGRELHGYDVKSPSWEGTASYFEGNIGGKGMDWVDLASDQATLYYTSESNTIFRYFLGTTADPQPRQLTPFATTLDANVKFYALRLLPPGDATASGGLLVAASVDVMRLDAQGNVVAIYDAPGEDTFFGLSISPDTTTFWAAGLRTGKVYQFDLASRRLLATYQTPSTSVSGLCIKLEYTAAREPCNGVDDDGNGIVDDSCLPVVFNDTYTTLEDQTLAVTTPGPLGKGVLANDTEPDHDPLTAILVTGPAHGTLTLNPDGSFSYTPSPNYNGADTFTYKANEGVFDSANVATVTINITPVNDPPVAGAMAVSTNEDVAAPIGLTATDVETAAANLTFTVTQPPAHGTLSGSGAALTYTPSANYNGPDSFVYTVTDRGDPDGCGAPGPACAAPLTSAPATVTVAMAPVNDPPSFVKGPDQTVLTNSGAQTVPNWATSISPGPPDESGQLVTFTVTGNSNPTLFSAPPSIASGGMLTYTPAPGAFGAAAITVVATDNGGTANGGIDTSAPQAFTITVVSNRPPVCSTAVAVPSRIWPPNHQLVPIAINGVANPDGNPVTITINSIFQDEPTNTEGDGNTAIDGFGVGASQARVRAERIGDKKTAGNGRVYHVRFTASAGLSSCDGDVTVGVPHDQRGEPAVDDGPRYDSTIAFPPLSAGKDDKGKKGDDKKQHDDVKKKDDGRNTKKIGAR